MEISNGPPSSTEDSVATNRLRLLACFVLPLALSVLIALLFEPLQLYQAEDYLGLALQPSAVPSSLFRPPEYIAFLHFINVVGGPVSIARAWPIYIGQGMVLGLFEEPLRPDSNNFPWLKLWFSCAIPLLEKQAGAAALDPNYPILPDDPKCVTTRLIVLDNILGSRMRELMRTQLNVYFSNFAHNAIFFWTGDSRMRIRRFVFCQFQDRYVHPITWATDFFIVSSAFLHVFGALGLALGLWRRNPTVTILASLFICFWAVHSIVYLDYRYLYVKFPFMLWFTGYLMSEYFKTRSSGKKTWCGFLQRSPCPRCSARC